MSLLVIAPHDTPHDIEVALTSALSSNATRIVVLASKSALSGALARLDHDAAKRFMTDAVEHLLHATASPPTPPTTASARVDVDAARSGRAVELVAGQVVVASNEPDADELLTANIAVCRGAHSSIVAAPGRTQCTLHDGATLKVDDDASCTLRTPDGVVTTVAYLAAQSTFTARSQS